MGLGLHRRVGAPARPDRSRRAPLTGNGTEPVDPGSGGRGRVRPAAGGGGSMTVRTTTPDPAGATHTADPANPGLPRWLVLLLGAAAATIAVAGLREIAWLVGPVFLALVVVIALAPVQGWLRRKG